MSNLVTVAGRSTTIQCTYPPFGASGSLTTTARFFAPDTVPDQLSGGGSPSPLQVYCSGIGLPSAKASLLTVTFFAGLGFGGGALNVDDASGWSGGFGWTGGGL